jgi:malonate-semialdehyde dehydrogenase (acetylating) / methylmalonate-semialdehyde dehydrogenase
MMSLISAVHIAKSAFPGWKAVSLLSRQQVLFRYVQLIRDNIEKLAAVITLEQGKTLADARGDILRPSGC